MPICSREHFSRFETPMPKVPHFGRYTTPPWKRDTRARHSGKNPPPGLPIETTLTNNKVYNTHA